MLIASRYTSRLSSLASIYPHVSDTQLKFIFPLFWTDDIEFCVFWENNGEMGHLFHSGVNTSLDSLPFSQYLGRHDPKVFKKRSLFEQTVRERKLLMQSLLKPHTDSFPVRILLKNAAQGKIENNKCMVSVKFLVGNTSWMHSCHYDFTLPNPGSFSWIGQTRFTGMIEPLGETVIEASIMFYTPGRYDINKWEMNLKMNLLIEKSGIPPNLISQVPSLPQFISVV
jgi:hypothetical protein